MQIPPDLFLLTRDACEFIKQSALSKLPILIEGETGSGKSALARLIHDHGPRSARSLVRVHCGAIPESLFERELFGHVKGAFTGADHSTMGLVEKADGGTLLLDDVDAIPLIVQPKILGLAEDHMVRRLGEPAARRFDTRLISTTNADLATRAARHEFRMDLFFRLAILQFRLRPLRERREDLEALTCRILRALLVTYFGQSGHVLPEIEPGAWRLLRAHHWPGNLRELGAVLARLLAKCGEAGPIREAQISAELQLQEDPIQESTGAGQALSRRNSPFYAPPSDPEEERRIIVEALRATGGNRTRAAESIGMSRQTLWIRIKVYRISTEEWSP